MTDYFKKLIPSLVSYTASIGLKHLVNKVIDKQKYKKEFKSVKALLETAPNFDDTIFSAAKKGNDLSEKIFSNQYQSVNEFYENFLEDNSDFKSKTDSVFIYSFFDQLAKSNILLNKELFLIIGKDEDKTTIFKYDFVNSKTLFLTERASPFGSYNYPAFLTNCNYKELIGDMIKSLNGNAYISFDPKTDKVIINKLKHETLLEDVLYNPEYFNILLKDIEKFTLANKQRSYLFLGEPGTGKTTMCYQLARKISDNVIKIDISFLKMFAEDLGEILVDYSGVKVVIIDDIDRITENNIDVNKLLYCIESIKGFNNKPFLLATANSLTEQTKALFRPGRFDKIFQFNLPTNEERKKYFQENIENINNEDIKNLVEATEKFSHVYLKEVCNQYNVGIPLKEIYEDLSFRKKLLDTNCEVEKNSTPK